MQTPITPDLVTLIENDLISRYGVLLKDDALRSSLGYPTKEAFRQALLRKQVPVPVFALKNRKGKFALSKDVAQWLADQRQRAFMDTDAVTNVKKGKEI